MISQYTLEDLEASTGNPQTLAQIEYVTGHYVEAAKRLEHLLHNSRGRPLRRAHARRLLSLAYFQANRFDQASALPLRDPLTRMMRAFPQPPNQVAWNAEKRVHLPFLQHELWQLPRVNVAANGTRMVAMLDTGGDLFSLPWSKAESLGVEPIATTVSWYAGGKRARTGFGRLEHLDLGGVTVTDVPVSFNNLDHPVIGTGLLRQFLPTLDYPEGRLTLRPRGSASPDAGFPFLLIYTHLLVAAGSLNGTPMRLLVDSGLEVENGACFAAPEATLRKVAIPVPERQPVSGMSGAGRSRLRIGEFPIKTISLGTESRQSQSGVTGVFPQQLARPLSLGIRLGGLISHNYLRHYRWTIDFDQMQMTLKI